MPTGGQTVDCSSEKNVGRFDFRGGDISEALCQFEPACVMEL